MTLLLYANQDISILLQQAQFKTANYKLKVHILFFIQIHWGRRRILVSLQDRVFREEYRSLTPVPELT